jgi:hypothetical protein
MLLDTLKETQTYHKSVLIDVLKEVKTLHKKTFIASSYLTVLRREALHIPVYMKVTRDPNTGWRLYTGAVIRKIVDWELKNLQRVKKSR